MGLNPGCSPSALPLASRWRAAIGPKLPLPCLWPSGGAGEQPLGLNPGCPPSALQVGDPQPRLTLLPHYQLLLVVAKVRGKNDLRCTCRCLKQAVDLVTESLTWGLSRGSLPRGARLTAAATDLPEGLRGLSLPALRSLTLDGMHRLTSLAGCPPTVQHLRCDELLNLTSLSGVPPGLLVLDCSLSGISDLGPLAACGGLRELRFGGCGPQFDEPMTMAVSDLGPLATCTALVELGCEYSQVASLAPLAACTAIKTLDVSNTAVADLSALAACKVLKTLICSDTQVASLAPLAGCTALEQLECVMTQVTPFSSLTLTPLLCPTSLLHHHHYSLPHHHSLLSAPHHYSSPPAFPAPLPSFHLHLHLPPLYQSSLYHFITHHSITLSLISHHPCPRRRALLTP